MTSGATGATAATGAAGPAGTAGRTTAGLRLTVLVGEGDLHGHRPLYSEIVHRAHRARLAGASVFRGIEGFGASSLIHTTRLLSVSEELPVAVVVVDVAERVRAFVAELREVVGETLVAWVDEVEIVR
ncbi:DUF190 domain-containing protein [Streptomyces xiamenensis]|uniref:DUF190 domain-containing protein n=1 Tax=Streptomyces TaxID=1883 RepID=UPI000997B345|nr:DUF190 domain-containing protein [Streptomyces sp. NRRL F-2890]